MNYRQFRIYVGVPTTGCYEKLKATKDGLASVFINIINRNKGYFGYGPMAAYNYLPVFVFTDEESLDQAIEDLNAYGYELTKGHNNDTIPAKDLTKEEYIRLVEAEKKARKKVN